MQVINFFIWGRKFGGSSFKPTIEDCLHGLQRPKVNDYGDNIRRELLLWSLDPLRDVIKSIIHPEDDKWRMRYKAFFSDVHDNLIRLVEMTETYRHMGLDLIESHVSLNSQRTNNVMVTLP